MLQCYIDATRLSRLSYISEFNLEANDGRKVVCRIPLLYRILHSSQLLAKRGSSILEWYRETLSSGSKLENV
jgi:hypothetical protein